MRKIAIRNTLHLIAALAVLTQTAACAKKDEANAAARVAKAQSRKVEAPVANPTAPVETKTANKSETKPEEKTKPVVALPADPAGGGSAGPLPAPDHIPGYNTNGGAFTGTLEVRADEMKLVKNTQCSFEIVEKEGKTLGVLNIGGFEVRMVLDKDWVQKDKQGFVKAALISQAEKKSFVVQPEKTVNIIYNVGFDKKDELAKIHRETSLVDEKSLGSQDLSEFVSVERKKLYADAKYSSMNVVQDGIYISLDAKNQPITFSYFKQEVIAGSGTEQVLANGDKKLSASYKNSLVGVCVGLKSEKK